MILKDKLLSCILGAAMSVSSVAASAAASNDADTLRTAKPGTSVREDRTTSAYSASGVSGSEIDIPTVSLTNMLYGRIPGLIVTERGGEPGKDGAYLDIRGIGTYNNNGYPIFVDGYQVDPEYAQNLSAFEIEDVRILKEAAALAPFGMRGANGVVWITTKRGIVSAPKVAFHARFGFQQPAAINKPLRTREYAGLYNEALSNDNGAWTTYYDPANVGSLPDVDWYDQVLRKVTHYGDANVSVRGGGERVKYYVKLGYTGNKGLYDIPVNDTLANNSFNRYSIRTNLDIAVTKFIDARIEFGGYVLRTTNPNTDINALWSNMARYPSLAYPVKSANGEWSGTTVYPNNPVAETQGTGRVSSHQRSMQFNLMLKEKLDFLLPGLYVQEGISLSNWTSDGASNTRTYARYLNDVIQTTDINTHYLRDENSGDGRWMWQHYTGAVGYDGVWNRHVLSVAVTALYNRYKTDAARNGAAQNFTSYRYANVTAAANYAYDGRYSADLTFTASGSDNYRPGKRWGYYPAAGLAWVVSNETFLKESRTVDYLKLRASAGVTGYDPMAQRRFLWERYYSSQGGVNLGYGTPGWNGGLGLLYLSNPDVFAEKSVKYDVGLDMRLWKNLEIELNFFMDKRSDILTRDNMIPSAAGAPESYKNIGEVTNKGYEATLSYAGKVSRFGYSVKAMVSYNTNEIDYMAEAVTVASAAATGHPINTPFGYAADGFYDVTDFNADGSLKEGMPVPTFGFVQPGDIKYKDLFGDGVIDENDKTKIGGASMPKYNFALQLGFSWRNLDLFALFQGVADRDVNLLNTSQARAFVNNGNVYEIARDRWAYYPEQGIDTRRTAKFPRLSLQDNNNNYQPSTFWMCNGDFLKLRNLELGYSLPKRWVGKIRIESARIYVNAVNLLEISKLKKDYGVDAEVISGYPSMKSYNIGLMVNF